MRRKLGRNYELLCIILPPPFKSVSSVIDVCISIVITNPDFFILLSLKILLLFLLLISPLICVNLFPLVICFSLSSSLKYAGSYFIPPTSDSLPMELQEPTTKPHLLVYLGSGDQIQVSMLGRKHSLEELAPHPCFACLLFLSFSSHLYVYSVWWSETTWGYLVISFYLVCAQDWAQVVRPVGECLYTPSYLTSPWPSFLMWMLIGIKVSLSNIFTI